MSINIFKPFCKEFFRHLPREHFFMHSVLLLLPGEYFKGVVAAEICFTQFISTFYDKVRPLLKTVGFV